MRFRELMDGDFPPEYRKVYMERARKALSKADDYVKVTIEKRKYPWAGEGEYIVHFSWNLKNNFFAFYDLLTEKEQEELRNLANKALSKIDAEFDGLKSQITPDKKFEVRIDYSLLFAVTHSHFNYRFEKWIMEAVGERYHYLNSREYLKKINSLSGSEQRQAMRQHGDDVKQTLELLRHLKELEN